jgi:hypothetical protein
LPITQAFPVLRDRRVGGVVPVLKVLIAANYFPPTAFPFGNAA